MNCVVCLCGFCDEITYLIHLRFSVDTVFVGLSVLDTFKSRKFMELSFSISVVVFYFLCC